MGAGTQIERRQSGRQGAETQGEGASRSFCFLVGGDGWGLGGGGHRDRVETGSRTEIQGEGASRVFLFCFQLGGIWGGRQGRQEAGMMQA